MRRRRFFRALALPVGLWFVALSVNLGAFDVCPAGHGVMGPGGAMAVVAMPPMSMGTAPSPKPASGSGGSSPPCNGVCCCCCAMLTLPSAGVTLPVAAVVPVRDAAPAAPATATAAAPQILLPPANGPPAIRTA
ncbi:MAG: hypothetical protein KGL38_10990 [Gemmatimonadota bacterium]|nr:hypothetical protein [Gemmatimonadota bacterium]